MTTPRNRWILLAAGLLTISLAGCGSTTGAVPVSGTVTLSDGTPLTQGAVNFMSAENSATGAIQSDGAYTMGSFDADDGVLPGAYQVAVVVGSSYGEQPGESVQIDPKFSNPSTSGLTCVVESGKPVTYDIVVDKAQ